MSEVPPPPPPPQHNSGFSNYPRANQISANPYQRPPGVYFDAIGQAWQMVQSNFGTWVPTILLAAILSYAMTAPVQYATNFLIFGSFLGQTNFSFSGFALSFLLGIVSGSLGAAITGGVLLMGLKQARGEAFGVGDIFGGFRRFGSLVLAQIITATLIYLGMALLIIPGLYLAGVLAFVPLLILDRNMSVGEAISTSYQTMKSHGLTMFALLFVAGLAVALGLIALCVGILFTAPIYMVTIGLTYNYFFPPAYGQQGFQPIGIEPPR